MYNEVLVNIQALVIDEKGRLLISKVKRAAFWQILGGCIEEGESHTVCLKRELRKELDAEIEVNPKMYKSSGEYFYYFCKLLTRPKSVESIEFIHYLTKKQVNNGSFEFSEDTKVFLLPSLIKDGLLL